MVWKSVCHWMSSPECKHFSRPGYQRRKPHCHWWLPYSMPQDCENRQSLCVTSVFNDNQTLKNALHHKFKCGLPLDLLWWYAFVKSWNGLSKLCNLALPALPDFLAYTDASGT